MSIIVVLAGLISGVLGGMGLGGGGVLILYLTIFLDMPHLKAQGINLLFFIPTAIAALVVYLNQGTVKLKPLLPYIFGGLAGSVVGIYISGAIGSTALQKLFGVGILLMGIKELFYKNSN